MKKIIFFDTETTGNTTPDRLLQIAWSDGANRQSLFFKPPLPISFESMAVHHITEKMVADRPLFKDSPEWKEIKDLFEDEETVVVAHNAPFDLAMLLKEDIVPAHSICTLKLAHFLDPEGKIPQHKLQYLRYFLDLNVEGLAHDALGDVLVLEKLFERLKVKIEESMPGDALENMMRISREPMLLPKIPFGKYKDKKIAEVRETDPGYLEWLLGEKLKEDPVNEDWVYTLKHYLGR